MTNGHTTHRLGARPAIVTAVLLMVPLVAMQLGTEVVWGPLDFAVAGTLLFGTGFTFELAARKARGLVHLAAAGLALGTALFLVWANLAVGVIGDEGNPANLMYLGVLTVGIIGAIRARFQPRGMAQALFATAGAQALVGAIALAARLGAPESGPLEIVWTNAMFVVLFGGSALLFRRAAREQSPTA